MAAKRTKKKGIDRYSFPDEQPPHGDPWWGLFLEEFQQRIEQILDGNAKRPDRSPENAVSEIFLILDAYALWGVMMSTDAPAHRPVFDLPQHIVECQTALARPAKADPHEFFLLFFALGWKAQVAFKARAWWNLKDQTRLASTKGTKAVVSKTAERNELIKNLAVPIAIKNKQWKNGQIAKQIIEDAKGFGPEMTWLAARGVDRVKRLIGSTVTEARKQHPGAKRSVRTDRA